VHVVAETKSAANQQLLLFGHSSSFHSHLYSESERQE
jgi:hypothetical protein